MSTRSVQRIASFMRCAALAGKASLAMSLAVLFAVPLQVGCGGSKEASSLSHLETLDQSKDEPTPSTDSSASPPASAPQAPPPPESPPPPLAYRESVPTDVSELAEEARNEGEQLADAVSYGCDALEVQARLLFLFGDHSAAEEVWCRAIERDPNYAFAYYGLGTVDVERGQFESAAENFREAVGRMPDFSDAVHELAEVLVTLGETDEAISALQDHCRRLPNSTETWVRLGQALTAAQRYDEAADAFRSALELYPEIPRAQYGLAQSLARSGQPEAAQQAMHKYQQLRAQEQQHRTSRREGWEDLDALRADVAERFLAAGQVYAADGQLLQTERLCRRACVLDPSNADAYAQAARLGLMLNRRDPQVAELADRAAQLRGTAMDWSLACQAWVMVDDLPRAATAIEQALQLDPESTELKQMRSFIQQHVQTSP